MLTEKYINLFTDFGFKRIFGTESNKDLLMDFLNAVLERANNPIINITYIKNEMIGKRYADRKAIFDLYCESEKQERFIIELQRGEQAFFKDRAVYYSSHAIHDQGRKGKHWDYSLLPVYTIAIMDFTFDDSNPEHASLVKLINLRTKEIFYDKLTFLFLEMPKFNKQRHELKTNADKWLYVFKNMHRLEAMPKEVQEGVFLKLFNQCEIANYNPKEYMAYEESVKVYRDWYAITKTIEDRSREEGRKEERKEGEKKLQQAKIKGIQKALQRGKLSVHEIAEDFEVSVEFVRQVQRGEVK